jgi:hypothetical protein
VDAQPDRRQNLRVGDRAGARWIIGIPFIIGDHRYSSSVARFVSPRVSKLHWIDATISELRLEVEDGNQLFVSLLEAARAASLQLIQLTGDH